MMQVKFNWPPVALNPNSRPHWSAKAKAAKKYKADCFYIAKKEIGQLKTAEKLQLFIDFYPPTNRARDVDNCLAMLKNGLDGLADALLVNDKQFVIHPSLKDELGGFVKIKIFYPA